MFDVYCPLIGFPSIDNCVIYYYRLMYTKTPPTEPDIVFCTAELGINTPIVDSKMYVPVCMYGAVFSEPNVERMASYHKLAYLRHYLIETFSPYTSRFTKVTKLS